MTDQVIVDTNTLVSVPLSPQRNPSITVPFFFPIDQGVIDIRIFQEYLIVFQDQIFF